MNELTNMVEKVEKVKQQSHETIWKLSCDESIKEWNEKSKLITIRNKKSKRYSWHRPRCGFIIDNKYCNHKSHFTGLDKNTKHDVDICDRKIFCYIHKKYEYSQYEKQTIRMETIILERIKNQNEFFITDDKKNYIEKIKKQYIDKNNNKK